MTVAGQKNHYNVKLLKGYGVSINLKDNRICLKGGRDPFTCEQESEEWFVTQIPYERIVISGKGYLSTEAVKLLTDHNINIILTDTYGNLITAMHKAMSSPTATNYRIAQYDTFRNPEKAAQLQNQFLKMKLESQIQFLQSIHRPEVQEAIDGLATYITKIDAAKDKRDLLTIESRAGYLYFRNYAKLFDRKYGFVSRNGGGIKTGNRYAADPINGLLNYGYTVLAGEIAKYVNGLGLDPYYGFFHVMHNSFQALVYDLVEPFRWLVEYAVFKIADETNHYHPITKHDYAWTREGRIVLDDDLIRRFLELLERKFQSERPYRFRHGIKRSDGLSMCQEITIVKITVCEIANFCRTIQSR
jgi:CRISPR-associated protein Cas1